MTMLVIVSSTSLGFKLGVWVSSSLGKTLLYCLFTVSAFCSSVIALVPSRDFSLPIVGLVLFLNLTNFWYDLESRRMLVAMFLSKVDLASLMRLVVRLRILMKFVCFS